MKHSNRRHSQGLIEGAFFAFFFFSLDLKPFERLHLKPLIKEKVKVKIGQPLLEDRGCEGRFFVSPAGGEILEIRRNEKRRLTNIVIKTEEKEELWPFPPLSLRDASRTDILDLLKKGGIFSQIRKRPFGLLANPQKIPRAIFVKALDSAPFAPPPELLVQGFEEEFQLGLQALSKLTEGKIHLVYDAKTTSKAFREAKGVEKHTAEGPHPIGTHSVHISLIDPVRSLDDIIWTLSTLDVLSIGHLILKRAIFTERIVSVAGPAILPERVGYYRIRQGYPIKNLMNQLKNQEARLISGDPLTGKEVNKEDFLGFSDQVFSAFPRDKRRKFFHFLRWGTKWFTNSRTYFSPQKKEYPFTTKLHGEKRFFIDSSPYDGVFPLDIPLALLVRAVMAKNFNLAEKIGLLEIVEEDFTLPTFVCPSKLELMGIMKEGIDEYVKIKGVE